MWEGSQGPRLEYLFYFYFLCLNIFISAPPPGQDVFLSEGISCPESVRMHSVARFPEVKQAEMADRLSLKSSGFFFFF